MTYPTEEAGPLGAVWRPPEPGFAALAEAREWATSHLRAWDLHDVVDDALLVLTELASNAIRHGAGLRQLSLEVGHRQAVRHHRLVIAAEDNNRAAPRRGATTDPEGGRGLVLVDAIAESSHCHWSNDNGKRVCAVLKTDQAAVSRPSTLRLARV